MNLLFYQNFYQSRLQKILSIFGKDWFANKKVLELGACHGHIGIELMKLGSDVTFTDLRQSNLDVINNTLSQYNIVSKTKVVNQENEYNLNQNFDLVLHLGILYHIQNWKQDLECAINQGKITILETSVNHMYFADKVYSSNDHTKEYLASYLGVEPKQILVRQESIENHLTSQGCKFIRFDNQDLNTPYSIFDTDKSTTVKFIYDWDYENSPRLLEASKKNDRNLRFRRFWLIVK